MAPQTLSSGRFTTAFMISGTYCFTCTQQGPAAASYHLPLCMRSPESHLSQVAKCKTAF